MFQVLFLLAQIDPSVLDGGDAGFDVIMKLIEAAQSGNLLLAGALLVTLIIWGLRRFVFPNFADRYPILLDKRLTLALTFIGPVAVGLVGILASGGTLTVPVIGALVIAGIKGALLSIGIFSATKNTIEASKPVSHLDDKQASLVIGKPGGLR